MKKLLFGLVVIFSLTGCGSASTKEAAAIKETEKSTEEKVHELPEVITVKEKEVTFGKDLVTIFDEYELIDIVNPGMINKEATEIPFTLKYKVDSSIVGLCTRIPWSGARDISNEEIEAMTKGIVQSISFTMEDIEPNVASYNGLDITKINVGIISEWTGEDFDKTADYGNYTFEADNVEIYVFFVEGSKHEIEDITIGLLKDDKK